MNERLTDEQVAHIAADPHQPTLATATLAREVQQRRAGDRIARNEIAALQAEVQAWRALAPQIIEGLHGLRFAGFAASEDAEYELAAVIDPIIAKLREASQ